MTNIQLYSYIGNGIFLAGVGIVFYALYRATLKIAEWRRPRGVSLEETF